MIDSRGTLAAYLDRRMPPAASGHDAGEPGQVLLRGLAASILPSGPESEWKRRPSLCHDGTPIVLSQKIERARSDALRLLIEPGSLTMTVAEQITFSLRTLDHLLGQLGWRSAADDINTITAAVLPTDPGMTAEWWGGIWLGADVSLAADEPRPPAELRIYLNLRHGDAASRWLRVAELLSCFSGSAPNAAIGAWLARLRPHTTPVGLGAVVIGGRVRGIRIYVVARYDAPMLGSLCQPISPAGAHALREAHSTFVSEFGSPVSQTVTLGYDFVRDDAGAFLPYIGRVKMELSCEGVARDRQAAIVPWLERCLADWSLEVDPLRGFFDEMREAWGGCDVQHVSLGFTPDPEHITVYVRPWS